MIYLFGGFLALVVGLALWRTLATMAPQRLARIARWVGIVVLGVAGLFLLTREAVLPALLVLGTMAFLYVQVRRGLQHTPTGGGAGQVSEASTAWLRMTLNHRTGETSGLVLLGAFKGRTLAELNAGELRALLGELRLNDPDGAKLLEAYLARVRPDFDAAPPPPQSSGAMTRDEALEILGLKDGASESHIREAHRRLMQQVHPDRGGSDYLAAKINAARDVLLG